MERPQEVGSNWSLSRVASSGRTWILERATRRGLNITNQPLLISRSQCVGLLLTKNERKPPSSIWQLEQNIKRVSNLPDSHMHFYYHYHYFLILVYFFKESFTQGWTIRNNQTGEGGGENFSVHEFFFQLTRLHYFFFWLCMNSSFSHCWQEIFFQTSFPWIIFWGWVGGGGGSELPRNRLLTDRPTYLTTYLPFC